MWLLRSDEQQNRWRERHHCAISNLPHVVYGPFGAILNARPFLLFFLHFLVFGLMAVTGSEELSPLAWMYFWAPMIGFIFYPYKVVENPETQLGLLIRRNPTKTFWVTGAAWAGIPFLAWSSFKHVDQKLFHMLLREIAGKWGILLPLLPSVPLLICALLQERRIRRERKAQREAEARKAVEDELRKKEFQRYTAEQNMLWERRLIELKRFGQVSVGGVTVCIAAPPRFPKQETQVPGDVQTGLEPGEKKQE